MGVRPGDDQEIIAAALRHALDRQIRIAELCTPTKLDVPVKFEARNEVAKRTLRSFARNSDWRRKVGVPNVQNVDRGSEKRAERDRVSQCVGRPWRKVDRNQDPLEATEAIRHRNYPTIARRRLENSGKCMPLGNSASASRPMRSPPALPLIAMILLFGRLRRIRGTRLDP
jgi:hypothetical protein